jgi:alkylation response protein AidB-like acyl-CoA dehydrogenase
VANLMDLSYGGAVEEFRQEVADFLDRHYRPEIRLRPDEVRAFRRRAIDAGLLYRAVPRKYGGSEQPTDLLRGQVIREEFARVDAPAEVPGVGVALLVPTLLAHGTEKQKQQFISPTLSGDMVWCQGYSEPDAGSDLESLRTTAVLNGDTWVINGQKVWTSNAVQADHMFLLARTDKTKPRRDGLSYLLLDMHQPGVMVRPLRQITGATGFNEVFFTDARTPHDMLVGRAGGGWQVSRTTLSSERGAYTGSDRSLALFASLIKLARRSEIDGKPAIADKMTRERLAELLGWVEAHRLATYLQTSRTLRGQPEGRIGLMNKQMLTDIHDRTSRLALDLLGESGMLDPSATERPGDERWLNQFFGSLGMSIAGGTSNIQRNIIAEQGLGLPRSPIRQDR